MEGKKKHDQTTLSEHDVARMQTVEAMYGADTEEVYPKREFTDMSVGWYTTPIDQDEP